MANIQLKIRTLADNDTEINSIKNTGNNVTNGSVKLVNSEGFFAKIPTADFAGQELLTFAGGALKFTSNGILANGSGNVGKLVDESDGKEFIWGVVPEGGEYYVEVQLSVSNLDLTAITLYGDSVAQQYPTEVIVNGQTYQNDDVVLTIPVNTNSTQINVKMTKWKRANYNACLTKIAIFAGEIQLENRDIKSLESLSQSTGQPESIFYGCVPSSGSASINDRKGEFYDYIKNGVISNSNSAIDLFVNGKKVQTHIATDSDYDLGGRVFSLDLENKLSAYDNIMYEGYPYTGNQQSLYNIFVDFAEKVGFTEQIDKMLSTEIEYTVNKNNSVGKVAEYFKSIIIPYPYIERGTVRETFDKFCTLAQLNLLEDDNGDLIFVQARPIRTGSERVLVIPAKNQMSTIDRDIVVKNKINNARVSISKATNEIDFNTLVHSEKIVSNEFEIREEHDKFLYNKGNLINDPMLMYLGVLNIGYYTGTITIPKNKNSNLISIDRLYYGADMQGNPNIKHKLTCSRVAGRASGIYEEKEDGVFSIDPNNIHYFATTDPIIASEDISILPLSNISLDIPLTSGNFYGELSDDDANKNLTNLGYVKPMLDINGNYVLTYRVLAKKTLVKISGKHYENAAVNLLDGWYRDSDGENWRGYIEYIPRELEISFYGDQRIISFTKEEIYGEKISNGNTITIDGNELLQDGTVVQLDNDGYILSTQISNNIVTDYKNGVSTCRVTVICGDYKDEAGVVRKNWAKGEILQVGDIVRLDKDNDGTPAVTYKDGSPMLWKITGRNLRHEGVSLLDLELQEIF